MEKSLSIKPNQPMNLSLEDVAHLKNPRLFISLDSDDQPNLLRSSVSSTSIPSMEYDQQHHHSSKQCTSCDALKRMLYLRDRTIMKLAEDRDMIKIKLTKAMNMNIELSRQLMKYQKINQSIPAGAPSSASNSVSPLRSKSPVNTQIREEVADLRRKCTELDEIYHHLKHHLFALRNVFADLGANTTNDSGSGYHMEDIDDCSSINSSLSRASPPLKQNGNDSYGNNKNSKAYIVEDDGQMELEDEGGNESADTDFHPLPPTRSALKNRFSKVDNNNNSGQQHQHQDKLLTESVETVQNQRNEVKSSVEIAVPDDDKPQLSNFDIWYNS